MAGLLLFILALVLGATVSPWLFLLALPVVFATWAADRGPWYLR